MITTSYCKMKNNINDFRFVCILLLLHIILTILVVFYSSRFLAIYGVFFIVFFALRKTKGTFIYFIFFLSILNDILGTRSLNFGFRIYLADLSFIFLAIFTLDVLRNKRVHSISFLGIHKVLIVNLSIGLSLICFSYLSGNAFNDLMGGFRRYYIYPLMFIVASNCIAKKKDIERISKLFFITLCTICLIAVVRSKLNISWESRADQFTFEDFRAIGYFAGSILILGVGIILGKYMDQKLSLFKSLICLAVLYLSIFISGYRLLWMMSIFLTFFMVFFLFLQKRNKKIAIKLIFSILFILLFVFYVGNIVFPDILANLLLKINDKVLNYNASQEIRLFAWSSAWKKFIESPFIGAGLGDTGGFWGLNSRGAQHFFQITYHSIIFELLAKTGMFGLIPFLLFICSYIYFVILSIKKKFTFSIVGGFGGWVAMVCMGCIQPSLSSPNEIALFYAYAGFFFSLIMSETKTSEKNNIAFGLRLS